MKKSKFTTEQIDYALRQAEAGLGVEETCRKLGISQATFFRWKAKYGDLGTPELGDSAMLQDVLAKAPGEFASSKARKGMASSDRKTLAY